MRSLAKILILSCFVSVANAQTFPVNLGINTQTTKLTVLNGVVYQSIDTASIVNPPVGMKIFWLHAGVDTAYWSRYGGRWNKDMSAISGGGSGSGNVIAKDTTVVFDGTFISFSVSPPPDSIAISGSATVDNFAAFGYSLSFANNKLTFNYPVAPIGTYLFHVLFTKPQYLP